MSATTTKAPDENSTPEAWKEWVRDRIDLYARTVVIDASVLLGLVAALADARDQNERLLKLLDEERNRL